MLSRSIITCHYGIKQSKFHNFARPPYFSYRLWEITEYSGRISNTEITFMPSFVENELEVQKLKRETHTHTHTHTHTQSILI